MAKNHRNNSNFQIANFIAGACHTPDGAYAALLDLKEEREMAIENYQVQQIRQQAKLENIFLTQQESKEASNAKSIQLSSQADLLEMQLNAKRGAVLLEAAVYELNFINECIKKIQPLRKYSQYVDLIANELAESEEWKFEFLTRAQNFILTTGFIPANEMAAMRLHPDFSTQIYPAIQAISNNCELLNKPSDFNFIEVLSLPNPEVN